MLKLVALAGVAAALALSAPPAYAVSGTSSGYGTEGYGPRVPTRSLTPFERSWNANNTSKREARESAEWMRRHHRSLPTPW